MKAIAGQVLKHPKDNILLEYLKKNNECYYNLIEPSGEGTSCTLYVDPNQNYANQMLYPNDIIFYLPPKVITDSSEYVFARNRSDKRFWVKCKILVITVYGEKKKKDELFIISLTPLKSVE